MKFRVDGMRRAVLGVALCAGALMAGCGGGEQVSTFSPIRVVAFGDEWSVINPDGAKYTVNAVVAGTSTIDCAANPIWVQVLATTYSLAFPQCPGTNSFPSGLIYAAPGAKVSDVVVQVDQQVTAGGFSNRDLVTLLAGANDVLELYAQYPAVSVTEIKDQLRLRGAQLGAQANRIGNLGGKVLASTVPDLGVTPFALAERAANSDADRAALLTDLSAAFNEGMRATLVNDGRVIGLLLTDELINAVVNNPGGNGYVNVVNAACSVALPQCTTNTLVADPNSTSGALASDQTWLWADNLHLSAGGQRLLGQLAVTRAGNNPF